MLNGFEKHRPEAALSCLIDAEEAAAQEKAQETSDICYHAVDVIYFVLLQVLVPTRWVCKDEVDSPGHIW